MREEKYHRLFRTLLTIVVAVSLSGCDWVLFDSKGQIGIEQRNLTIFVTPRIIPTSDKSDYEDARLRLRERLSGLDLKPKSEPEQTRSLNEP